MTTMSWTLRVWQEFRAGTLTRTYRDVLLTLKTYRGRDGLICPAHATLAERTKSSVSTVQRALHQAQRLGLVEWTERRVRAGWRWLRSSNRYWLTVPDAPVDATLRPVWRRRATNGQNDGGGESVKREVLAALPWAVVRVAQETLAVIATRRRQALGLGAG